MILNIDEFIIQRAGVETKIMSRFNYNRDDFDDDDWRTIFDAKDNEKIVSKYFTPKQKEKFYDMLNKYRNYSDSLYQLVK